MKRRPIAHFPSVRRGRREKALRTADVFLAVPRLDPEWELSALHVLMKPPRKAAVVRNRTPEQPWTPQLAESLTATARLVCARLAAPLDLHLPAEGDFHLIAQGPDEPTLLALALALSHTAPGLTFKLGRLYVRDRAFFRRRRGVELALGPARDIHLTREHRAALADLLRARS